MLEELVSKDGLQGDLLRELAPSGRLGSGDAEGFSVEHEMNSLIAKEFPFKKKNCIQIPHMRILKFIIGSKLFCVYLVSLLAPLHLIHPGKGNTTKFQLILQFNC